MTRRSRRLAWAGSVVGGLAIVLAACQVLVPGALPDFQCTGTDSTSCPTGLVCDPASGRCALPIPDTEGGPIHPTDAGTPDVKPPLSMLGGPCGKDSDCVPGLGLFCGNSTILSVKTDPVCTKPCCTSSECDPGFVCYPTGIATYCVAASLADRKPPDDGGGAPPGASCVNNNECRSGQCFNSERCLDTCCNDQACANDTICGLLPDVVGAGGSAHAAWSCIVPFDGGLDLQENCSRNEECKNGNCAYHPYPTSQCDPTCCSTNDCIKAGLGDNACGYGSTLSQDKLKWCFDKANFGTKLEGTDCAEDKECATDFCDTSRPRVCLRVCCIDTDCNPGEACRPSDGTPRLRCVKNAGPT